MVPTLYLVNLPQPRIKSAPCTMHECQGQDALVGPQRSTGHLTAKLFHEAVCLSCAGRALEGGNDHVLNTRVRPSPFGTSSK